jgi:hypothetical protein
MDASAFLRSASFPPHVFYPLTRDEVAQAEDFCARYRAAKPAPIVAGATAVETDWQLAGKLVEVAAGALLDLPVDWAIYAGKDHHDFTLRNGATLNVRSVTAKALDFDYWLQWRTREAEPQNLALGLVTPARDGVLLAGYLPFYAFAKLAVPIPGFKARHDGDPLGVKRSRLRPFADLIDREEMFARWVAAAPPPRVVEDVREIELVAAPRADPRLWEDDDD